MRPALLCLAAAFFLLTGCATPAPEAASPDLVVQYTPAAAPWLADLMDCAGSHIVSTEVRSADFIDLQTADLAVRLGQPDRLDTPAYQVGSDDLQIILNPHIPLDRLTAEQVRAVFTGQVENWQALGGSDLAVQVWVFAPGDDLQSILIHTLLLGSPVSANARLATSPEEMLRSVAADPGAVGLLNGRLTSQEVSAVYTLASVPVLALTPPDPPTAVTDLIACMQK